MSTRLLGTICIIGSVIILLDAFRQSALGIDGDGFDTIGHIALIFWAVGGIAALVGMIQLNAVGSNSVVRGLAFVPIIGFILLILASIMAGLVTTDNDTLAGIGWLLQLAGMVLVGILTIAAKTWHGWRRFVPLLTIVAVPIGFGIGSVIGNLALGAAIVYVVWLLLGYIVATAEPVPAFTQSATA